MADDRRLPRLPCLLQNEGQEAPCQPAGFRPGPVDRGREVIEPPLLRTSGIQSIQPRAIAFADANVGRLRFGGSFDFGMPLEFAASLKGLGCEIEAGAEEFS